MAEQNPPSLYTHPTPKHYALGVLLMILSSVFFAFSGAFAKIAGAKLNIEVVTFYQFVMATLIMAPFVLRQGFQLLKTKHPYLHLIRDASGFCFFYFLYLSLSSLLLVDAIVLSNTAPLLVPLVILIWFRIRLHFGLWISLLIGFIGIVVILHPGGKDFLKPGSLLALFSGCAGGVGLVAIRRLVQTDKTETINFYYFLFSSIILIPIISIFYKWQWPQRNEWWPILGMGVCMPVMQYLQAKSSYFAPASRVAPFFYASIVFSGLLGWWFWEEIPSKLSLIGIALVVAGALLSVFIGKPPSIPKDNS